MNKKAQITRWVLGPLLALAVSAAPTFALAQSAPASGADAAAIVQAATAPLAATPMPAGAALCEAPWFRSGSRVQMEGDGDMPMSITMILRDVMRWDTGCSAQLEVRSKSALAALKGPPVDTNQMHEINIDRRGASSKTSIDSRNAVINARARYARVFGEAAFRGSGVFNYAGLDIREGMMLEGETFRSSVSLKIYPIARDEEVGTIQALYASVIVGSRHVGRKQMIDTVLGRRECLPITYEKRTSLGPLQVGDEMLQVEPSLLNVTDWYCPSDAFVLRTEIRQNNRLQRVDVTAMEIDPPDR
ncbi:hypothetical protein LMG32289_02587 [Cupriavidus pampae]|uniref:DUF3108 domain-containing protein n=1 Tax=Cupriavidus pampae TaxID=659251 RepID=A0ABN7YFJ3_9BURK|nr:hypothetical protein LMG32289_02587 [Cupriavidus pampae]